MALLDDSITEVGRFYFDRGIWAWGNEVERRVNDAATSSNLSIAAAQRQREFYRLMGMEDDSMSAFADPIEAASPHALIDDGDSGGETVLNSGF